jgi:pantoate--beta-alanine ligase
VQVHPTIASLRAALDGVRAGGGRVGFVPTMGYLHEGHLSLVGAAVADGCVAAASVFVNPLQFAADEDLADYPRDLERDLRLLEEAGTAHVLVPSVEEMYPTGTPATVVTVRGASEGMEGAARPTHFAGVATVVTKLFAIVGPARSYFGEKDYQQLVVVRRLAADLSLPVEVVGCPTVREPDGLARSSRNVYLGPAERAAAPVLHRALQAGVAAVLAGERSGAAVAALVRDVLAAEPLVDPDYAEVRDAASLAPLDRLVAGQEVRILVAARVGRPRLLDNAGVVVPPT